MPKELVAIHFAPVITDVNAIGVSVFVPNAFALFFVRTDLPRFARVHIQAPNAIIDEILRLFETEGQQMGLGG
ncbi:MAG: hypothetical protein AAF629_22705 [Chloroflexota bacterium]